MLLQSGSTNSLWNVHSFWSMRDWQRKRRRRRPTHTWKQSETIVQKWRMMILLAWKQKLVNRQPWQHHLVQSKPLERAKPTTGTSWRTNLDAKGSAICLSEVCSQCSLLCLQFHEMPVTTLLLLKCVSSHYSHWYDVLFLLHSRVIFACAASFSSTVPPSDRGYHGCCSRALSECRFQMKKR
jgi:hypothetical protein